MKALSLHQPEAQLIAEGIKTVETRSWRAPQSMIGQRFAVHAAKKRPRDQWRDFRSGRPLPAKLAPFWDEGRYVDHQESSDGDWWRYRWDGPLGEVVATARLVDCVPMGFAAQRATATHVGVWSDRDGAGAILYHFDGVGGALVKATDISHQLPYGEFAAGRWAWLLADVEKLDVSVPWKGRPGWFEVNLGVDTQRAAMSLRAGAT